MEKNDERDIDRLIAENFAALRPDDGWQPNLHRGLARFREGQLLKRRRGQRWAWIVAAAVATCVPLIAFPVTRAFAERCVSACVTESGALRQFLLGNASSPGPSGTSINPADRKMAPDFTLNDASGRPVRLSDLRGKVVLLNFWATWCAPCKREIPWFVEFQESWRDRGFAVLGVSMDADGWSSVNPYIEDQKVNYQVMIGSDQVAKLYGGLNSLPATLVIDRSGRIAAIHLGLCRKDEYENDINAVLNERQEQNK